MTNRLNDRRGFTLIEVLISLVILSISSFAVAALLASGLQWSARASLNETKDRVIANLTRLSSLPAALRAACYASWDQEIFNTYFNICVMGDPTWAIQCQNMDSFTGFRLYLPTVETITIGPDVKYLTSAAITGTPNYPIRYSSTGQSCDTSIEKCLGIDWPIEVFTEFQPMCYTQWEAIWNGWVPMPEPPQPVYPDGLKPVNTCWVARYMRVRLTVRPSSDGNYKFKPFIRETMVDSALVRTARQ